MRLFIALELPVLLGDWAEAFQQRLRRAESTVLGRPRWVPLDELHITLQFLGEVSDPNLPAMSAVLHDMASLWGPFRLSLGTLGTFGGPRGGALWVGVNEGAKTVVEIAMHLRERLGRLGYKAEKRTFLPHVTLARTRQKVESKTLRALPAPLQPCPEAFADTLTLFQSHLGPSGAHYTRCVSARLG